MRPLVTPILVESDGETLGVRSYSGFLGCRVACAALELSDGVSELKSVSACVYNDDDAAALLDRLRRFGSNVQKLAFTGCGRAVLENPVFHALVPTLPKLHVLYVRIKEALRPEALRGLAAAVSASQTLTEVNVSGVGITSESCGAWHDMLTRAPALRRFTIGENPLSDANRRLLLRSVAFSRNACSFFVFDVRWMHENSLMAQKAAKARLASAERFTAFVAAEKFCVARSPARRFLEGDGDRAIAWRVLRLLGVQP